MFHGLMIENCVATDRKIMMVFVKNANAVGLQAAFSSLSLP